MTDDFTGMTLEQVRDMRPSPFALFGRCSVYVKKPDESATAPGRMATEHLSLQRTLKLRPDLSDYIVTDHNMYFGEHVFRVTAPART